MKFVSVCFFLLMYQIAKGQSSGELQSLIHAEKAFAQLAKEKNTREAFIAFFSDSGLIFQAGPVLGKKFWQNAKEESDLLTWEPVFAGIAASGDMGYTTGPWEFRQNRTATNASAVGYFVSVWKKEMDAWKVVLDIGISFPAATQKETGNFINSPGFSFESLPGKDFKMELLAKEQQFITAQKDKGWKVYDQYMAPGARIYRPGNFPYITEESRRLLFLETNKKFSYEPINANVATSGDMGYVYGKATIETIQLDKTQKLEGNYLRIWKRDKDADWKIVLDLVNIAR